MNEPANSIVAAGHFNKITAAARVLDEVLKNLPKWMAPSARVPGNYATAEVTREGTVQLTGEVAPADIPALLTWIAEVAELELAALRPCGHPASPVGQVIGPEGTSETQDSGCQDCVNARTNEALANRITTILRELSEKTRQLGEARDDIRDLQATVSQNNLTIDGLKIQLVNHRIHADRLTRSRNRYKAKLRLVDIRLGVKKSKKRTNRRK